MVKIVGRLLASPKIKDPCPDKKKKKKSSFIVNRKENNVAEILLYGNIGFEVDGNEIAQTIKDLNDEGFEEIHERINSPGGGVVNGLSVVAANLNSDARIITYNDGAAFSMGGIILMTGNEIHMADYAQLMIHEPSICGETIETTKDPKTKEGLIHIRDCLAKIIMNRTKKNRKEVNEIMEKETWYSAGQAKSGGFVDTVFKTSQKNLMASLTGSNKDGSIWDITIINSGHASCQTGKVFVPPEVLKASVPLWEGIDVYMHQFGLTPDGRMELRHRPIQMKTNGVFGSKTGYVKNVKAEDRGDVVLLTGKYHIQNPVVRETFLEIWRDDRSRMPEFSVNADYEAERIGDTAHISKFTKATSLDIVTEGAFSEAGFNRLAASKDNMEDIMLEKIYAKILAMVKVGTFKLTGETEGKSDDEIKDMVKETLGIETDKKKEIEDAINKALTADKLKNILGLEKLDEIIEAVGKLKKDSPADPPVEPAADPDPAPAVDPPADPPVDPESEIQKVMDEVKAMKIQASEAMVDAVLTTDQNLTEATREQIRNSFKGKIVEKATVQASIKSHKEYLDKILASANVASGSITVGDNMEKTKLEKLVEIFINPNANEDHEDEKGEKVEGHHIPYHEQFHNMQDVLRAFAGHMNFEGIKTMQAASTTANFTVVFQDVMNKQIRKQYGFASVDAAWKKLTEETSYDTLDQQHIYDIGSLGLVSNVAEAGTYQEFTRPTDVEATIDLKKVGNTLVISEEMLLTSGTKVTQLIRQFPRKMADAAVATLSKYVFDFITGCDSSSGVNSQTIYDGLVLYHGQHSNITSSALAFASYSAGYTAMVNQIVRSSVFPADINPRYLLVATERREVAHVILKNATYARADDAGTGVAGVGNPFNFDKVDPIVVPKYYLCNDSNNWYLIGNKMNHPTLQLGYFQNQRVPQMFLQNNPTVAAVFTADQWTWKVKWRFGAGILDYRTFYGGLVAGT